MEEAGKPAGELYVRVHHLLKVRVRDHVSGESDTVLAQKTEGACVLYNSGEGDPRVYSGEGDPKVYSGEGDPREGTEVDAAAELVRVVLLESNTPVVEPLSDKVLVENLTLKTVKGY